MANLKHIEFTTEAKYQGKVKSDDTLYAVPFTGGGGGGGTTLNKYTYVASLATVITSQRFRNILANAKRVIGTITYKKESSGTSKTLVICGLYANDNSLYIEASNVNATNGDHTILYASYSTITGSVKYNNLLQTETSFICDTASPTQSGINIIYWNDTEITE